MQNLASDVGGLKRVLTNVKNRGGWGEVQLSRQLEDFLTREQYAENIIIKEHSQESVEFAVKMPGRDPEGSEVYLPIDSKFPRKTTNGSWKPKNLGIVLRLMPAQKRWNALLLSRQRRSATSTFPRRGARILPSCTCLRKVFSLRLCADLGWRVASKTTTVSSSLAQRR